MPKGPIMYRETFFCQVRGAPNDYLGQPSLKQLEWFVVETEIGTMVESRPISDMVAGELSQVKQLDMTDAAITRVSRIDEGIFQNQYGTGGSGMVDYNA